MSDDKGAVPVPSLEAAAEELARAWVEAAHQASARLRLQAQREADAIVADAKRTMAAAQAQVARLRAYAAEVTGGIDALARLPEEPVAPVWDPLGLRAEDLPRGPEVRADPAPGAPTGERAGAPAALLASVNGHTMPAFRVVPPGPAVDVDVGVEAAGRSPEAASDVSPAFVPLLGSRGRHLACGPAGADHAAEPPAPERPSAGPATGSRR